MEQDEPGAYAPRTGFNQKWRNELPLGSAVIRERYVSFYLMLVYIFPDLLREIQPELRKRMQGKSCLNFTSLKPLLLADLSDLTDACIERCRRENVV